MIKVEYQPDSFQWAATWSDDIGQLGEAVLSGTRDYALVFLGMEMGKNPTKFLRPMSTYFKEVESRPTKTIEQLKAEWEAAEAAWSDAKATMINGGALWDVAVTARRAYTYAKEAR